MSYKGLGDGLVAGPTTNNCTEIQAATGTENPICDNYIGLPKSKPNPSMQDNKSAASHNGSLRGIVEFCRILCISSYPLYEF